MAISMNRTIALITLMLAGCASQTVILTEPQNNIASSAASVPTATLPSSAVASVPEKTPSVRIAMPFASQAPFGNWGEPYQEACEEASLLLVHHYLAHEPLSKEIMDRAILDLVAWETANGYPQDVRIDQLAAIARDRYGYVTEIMRGDTDVTAERIERELANGNPVIVPLQGQDIGNPYYSGDGPPYHMLVIVGYDGNNFITHDVGTRHGEYYAYRKQIILNAIHDWTGSKETMREGPKAMMIVQPNRREI